MDIRDIGRECVTKIDKAIARERWLAFIIHEALRGYVTH